MRRGPEIGRQELARGALKRQQLVEPAGHDPDQDAQRRRDPHRQQHVERRLLRTLAAIVPEEGEIRDLDARVLEHTCRSKQQHQPHEKQRRIRVACRHHHRLRYEAGEERQRRNGGCSDQTEQRRPRHGSMQAAKVGGLGRSDAIEHRAHTHEQQRLVHDVRERVRHRAVDGQLRADAQGAHHEADLVVQAVGKHPPEVVLDHREEDREHGHDRADPDQPLKAREIPRQRIDGELGGERREHDGPRLRRFRIGVLQPVVHHRERRLDPEPGQDQHRTGRVDVHHPDREPRHRRRDVRKLRLARRRDEHADPRQHQHPRGYLEDEIAHRRPHALLGPRRQHLEHRRDRRQLPRDEQAHQISDEHRRHGRARIEHRCCVLQRIATVE